MYIYKMKCVLEEMGRNMGRAGSVSKKQRKMKDQNTEKGLQIVFDSGSMSTSKIAQQGKRKFKGGESETVEATVKR